MILHVRIVVQLAFVAVGVLACAGGGSAVGQPLSPSCGGRSANGNVGADSLAGTYQLMVTGGAGAPGAFPVRGTLVLRSVGELAGHDSVLARLRYGSLDAPFFGWIDVESGRFESEPMPTDPASRRPGEPGVLVVRGVTSGELVMQVGAPGSLHAGLLFTVDSVGERGFSGRWGVNNTGRVPWGFRACRLAEHSVR